MPKYRILPGRNTAWWILSASRISRSEECPVDAVGTPTLAALAAFSEVGHVSARAAADSYAITVLTSTDCNLRCPYCFQNESLTDGGPQRIPARGMTAATAQAIAELAKRQALQNSRPMIDVLLFGGEPLMNVDGCVTLLRALGGSLKSATMTTNGVLLTGNRLERLIDAGLKSVQVTLDGAQPDHDLSRRKVNGGGSFAVILDNLELVAQQSTLDITIRVNVTEVNRRGMPELIQVIAHRVPKQRVHLYFAPVTDPGLGYSPAANRQSDLADRFVSWLQAAHQAGLLIRPPRGGNFCGFCSEQDARFGFVAGPDGRLYSCWETAGREDFVVGTAWAGLYADRKSRWKSCGFNTTTTRPESELGMASFLDLVDGRTLDWMYEEARELLGSQHVSG